ncbi:MAG TPA: hypothetical protein VFN55_00380 [Solirubrobacteraceae bacterium]|nr:hypothetical protein [Solirubrobacteraceae bacterium]
MADSPATELYGLPLAEFIPERSARVKALRAQKRRDEAAQVAALRKPSVAAWAVNQLIRTQGRAVTRLFEAGDAIATAQAGGKADALRKASGEQREAIDELMSGAEGLLSSHGHPLSPVTLERVRETLRAASIDAESRERVAGGCLTQELQFAGLGIGDLPMVAADAPASSEADADGSRGAGGAEAAEAEAERERTQALTAARQAQTEARRRMSRAEKALQAARTKHEQAQAALDQAAASLAEASDRAKQAGAELEQAARAVRALDRAG